MLDYSQPDIDIIPFAPREDNPPAPPDRYGPFVHLGYLIQRMRQPSPMTGARAIAPERLQDIFPPHVIEDLHRIDWSSCDLPLVFALGSRFAWLWSLRFDQVKTRIYVHGDQYIYSNLHLTMKSLFQASVSLYDVQASARALVPEQLPDADSTEFIDPSVQRSTLLAIEFFLRDVAHFAHANGINHRPEHINAALYPWDSSFYNYRNRVREIISQHGSWTGTRIRLFEEHDNIQRRRGVSNLVPFRRRKRQTGSLSVAMFAMQRLLSLWQAFDALHTLRPPTEAEQAIYRIERDMAFAGIQGNDNYAHLPFRLDTLIPRFLQASKGTRSLSHDPHPPIERIRMGMDELDRTARHLGEPIVMSPTGGEMVSWYPAGQFERYAAMLRSLSSSRGGSPQVLQVITLPSGEDVSNESEIFSDKPSTEPTTEAIGRGGRPRIDIPYDLLAQIHNDLMNLQIKEERDRITPISYRLIRDRYIHDTGRTISEETIANRVKQWRADGLSWPPAYTGEADEDDD